MHASLLAARFCPDSRSRLLQQAWGTSGGGGGRPQHRKLVCPKITIGPPPESLRGYGDARRARKRVLVAGPFLGGSPCRVTTPVCSAGGPFARCAPVRSTAVGLGRERFRSCSLKACSDGRACSIGAEMPAEVGTSTAARSESHPLPPPAPAAAVATPCMLCACACPALRSSGSRTYSFLVQTAPVLTSLGDTGCTAHHSTEHMPGPGADVAATDAGTSSTAAVMRRLIHTFSCAISLCISCTCPCPPMDYTGFQQNGVMPRYTNRRRQHPACCGSCKGGGME